MHEARLAFCRAIDHVKEQRWEAAVVCVLRGPGPAGEAFPHLNDATDFSRRQRDQYRHIARMLRPVLGVAITGPALALGLSRRRERRLGRG